MYYDSPLYSLFSRLYSLFKEYDENHSNALYNNAENYFSMLKIIYNNNMPRHIEKLLENIINKDFFNDLHYKLNCLYELSVTCNLCISCEKCAEKFYVALALLFKDNLTEDQLTIWENRNEKLGEELDGEYVFKTIPYSIEKHLIKRETINLRYLKLHEQYSAKNHYNGHLLMLKGMSSSSPQLYNSVLSSHVFTGGGIYIRWEHMGIAIDPGPGFIENMYKHNLYIQDIDVIIITHFHLDHTGDIRLIDDLNRYINGRIPTFESKEDEIIYKEYYSPKHVINWYIDGDTNAYFMNKFSTLINNINTINPGDEICIDDGICISTFHTQHVQLTSIERNDCGKIKYGKDNSPELKTSISDKTFGICINLLDSDTKTNTRIGYTSDTKYDTTILHNLQDCDYIIANISGIYKDDFLMLKSKKNHLGYLGCLKLLNNVKPKLLIISEFWNGTTDLRIDICRELEKEQTIIDNKGIETKVMPGEIGLNINIKEFSVRCDICGKFSPIFECHTVAPQNEFGRLLVLCSDCCK